MNHSLAAGRYKRQWLCWSLLISLSVLCSHCKKPEVEVEEEGPPLPLPLGQESKGNPAGVSPSGEQKPVPPEIDEKGLSLKNACRLLVAHLKYADLTVDEYQCNNLRKEGESLRLDSFMLLDSKDKTRVTTSYNACFWPKTVGKGWEVGYVDQVLRPCVNREDYCKLGAQGSLPELSFKACPGDEENLIVSKKSWMEKLVGTWVNKKEGGRIVINKVGFINVSTEELTVVGHINVLSTSSLEIVTKKNVIPMAYAIMDDKLHLARGLIAPANNPDSFTIALSPNQRIRRFRGACYEVLSKPNKFPKPMKCERYKAGEIEAIDIPLKSRTINLYRKGNYWMDSAGLRFAYQRAGKKVKTKTPKSSNPQPLPQQ